MNAAKGWCVELWVRYISGLGSGQAFEVFADGSRRWHRELFWFCGHVWLREGEPGRPVGRTDASTERTPGTFCYSYCREPQHRLFF